MDYVAPDGRDRIIPRFHIKPVRDNFQSEKQGREVWNDVEYVELIVPGDNKNIVDVAVKDEHRDRWPTKYAAFKANMEAPESGTPLDEWAGVGRSQVMELNSVHIRTVEALASLSDAQLAKCVPMGGHALRAKAQRFIEQTDAEKPLAEMTQRIRELEDKLAAALEATKEKEAA